MPYIYRYIDLDKEEVCYIGKVTKPDEVGINRLERRHEQHKADKWYKEIGGENLLLQYIELDNHTDADIFETWLIQYYDTGQLYNRSKTGWGKSRIDFYSCIFGKWRNFRQNTGNNYNEIYGHLKTLADIIAKSSEGFRYNVDSALEYFCEHVKELQSDINKADRVSRFNQQADFLRGDSK